MLRPLRLCSLLLGGLAGPLCHAQAPVAAGALTPGTLAQVCAAQAGTPCTVPLNGQSTLTLQGDWHMPRSLHLRFAPGSALHIAGGVLHFDGGSIEAPADERIFPEGERVRGLAAARPEWFAAAHQEPLPPTALAAAYQATEPWGTLYLQARRYVSPFNPCVGGDALPYASPRTLVGAGRPMPDDPGRPTHLASGTMLLGGIMGTAPVRLAHLGVDSGPEVSAGLLHGCKPPAVFIEQPSHRFVSGDRLEDVSALTTGDFNMHSVMIAGHEDAKIHDLWIWTLGGTHGLVLKSSHSVVDGLHCFGAVSDCLIVKSDYATDMLGRAVQDRIAHVDIGPLQPGGTVGGIMVESRWDTVRSLDMQGITETGAVFGIVLLGSPFFRPEDISIRNWSADAVSGACLFADRADAVQVSGFRCGMRPSAEAGLILLKSRNVLLQRGSLSCDGTAEQCAAGHTDGIRDTAAGTSLEQVSAQGLGGYLLRSAHPPIRPADLQTTGMEGRVFAPYTLPWSLRWEDALGEFKPSLRILYTAALTRVMLHPGFFVSLAALLSLLVGWRVVHRVRRERAS